MSALSIGAGCRCTCVLTEWEGGVGGSMRAQEKKFLIRRVCVPLPRFDKGGVAATKAETRGKRPRDRQKWCVAMGFGSNAGKANGPGGPGNGGGGKGLE